MIKRETIVTTFALLIGLVIGFLAANISINNVESSTLQTWGNLSLTATLVAITAYYAWQTRQSVRIMEESSLPYVSLHLENEPSHISDIYLVIRNDGDQAAFDVNLKVISGDITVLEGISYKQKLSELGAVKSTLAVLSPKSERRHLVIMSSPKKWEQIKNVQTVLEITFRDKNGSQYNHEFCLDYASLPFVGQPSDSTYQKVEKSLQNIDLTLKELAKK